MITKLSYSLMQRLKHQWIREQGGVSPLSLKPLDGGKDSVVDHDHETGRVRGVLSRADNKVEGVVRRGVETWGGVGKDNEKEYLAYLKRLVTYLEQEQKHYIYPGHKTIEERRALSNKRRRQAYARKKARERVNVKK